jgi:hypothetical protein
VELINHQVLELRRDIARVVPGKFGAADDAVAGKRRGQFPRVGVAFGAFAAIANHVVQITPAIHHARDEAPPVALIVAREQTGIIALAAVEIADHVHGMRPWRPNAESGAAIHQVRAHRSFPRDVVQ